MKKTIRLIAVAMVAVMLCLSLASCGGPNADPDKALEALKDNGVNWAVKDDTVTPGLLSLAGIKDVDCVVSGTGEIEDEGAHITILYFEDKEAADNAWDKVQEKAEDEKKDNEDSEWVCKKSGKMIYYGTKNAVKAAR